MITQQEINKMREKWTKEELVLALQSADEDKEKMIRKMIKMEKFFFNHVNDMTAALKTANVDPEFEFPEN